MTEKEFWVVFRRCLLLMVDAIEKRYELGKYAPSKTVTVQPTDSIARVEL